MPLHPRHPPLVQRDLDHHQVPARAHRRIRWGNGKQKKKFPSREPWGGEGKGVRWVARRRQWRRRPWGTRCQNAAAHLGWAPAVAAWRRSSGSAVAAFPSDFFGFVWLGTLGRPSFARTVVGRCQRKDLWSEPRRQDWASG
jgi:hypothetical protein